MANRIQPAMRCPWGHALPAGRSCHLLPGPQGALATKICSRAPQTLALRCCDRIQASIARAVGVCAPQRHPWTMASATGAGCVGIRRWSSNNGRSKEVALARYGRPRSDMLPSHPDQRPPALDIDITAAATNGPSYNMFSTGLSASICTWALRRLNRALGAAGGGAIQGCVDAAVGDGTTPPPLTT